MADLFHMQGYSVTRTPGSGDQGTDLLVIMNDRKIAVLGETMFSCGRKAPDRNHLYDRR